MACNECRRRKVKCDAEYPKCRNCSLREAECITSDPRRPGYPVVREWVDDKAVPLSGIHEYSETGSGNRGLSSTMSEDWSGGVATTNNHTGASNHSRPAHHQPQRPPATPIDPHAYSSAVSVAQSSNQPSPAYHMYEMSFQTQSGTNRIKMMGASSSACLMRSFDLYLAVANIRPVSPSFQHGIAYAEEMSLPLEVSLPKFPPFESRSAYTAIYFRNIHTPYPVFDIDATKHAIHSLASIADLRSLPREQIPLLATAYLIMSLGADESAQRVTPEGTDYLLAASSLLAHVLQSPYLPAVQTFLLFAIAYRGRNKDGVAWQMVGLAVRTGHTLGLHKHSAERPSSDHGVTQRSDQLFHARIWAVCCCLEKMLQLELGRPSSIGNVDLDQMMVKLQRAPGHDFLQWNMSLAEYQGDISQHIYNKYAAPVASGSATTTGTATATSTNTTSATGATITPASRTAQSILLDTVRLDRLLQAWSESLPSEFKPGNELYCSTPYLHIATHLSTQWHGSMIALHRAALIAPSGFFDAEVDRYCTDETPGKFRLKRGEQICVSSARSIIRLSLDVVEQGCESRLLNAGPALLACVAIAISLMKRPWGGRAQAADLELLKAGARFTADQYVATGQDARVAQGIVSIYDKVTVHLQRYEQGKKSGHGGSGSGSGSGSTPLKHQQPNVQRPPVTKINGNDDNNNNNNNKNASANTHWQSPTSTVASGLQAERTANGGADGMTNNATPRSNTAGSHPVRTYNDIDLLNQPAPLGQSSSLETDAWNTQSQAPGPLQPYNFDMSQNLFISQDAEPEIEALPFANFNVEEMWNWMIAVDSAGPSGTAFFP